MDRVTPKRVVAYADSNGQEPFTDWLNGLRDVIGRKRILARVSRLHQGNYGDCESVGEGVSELRLFFGSGYRVYFGEEGSQSCRIALRRRQEQSKQRHSTGKSLWESVSESWVTIELSAK